MAVLGNQVSITAVQQQVELTGLSPNAFVFKAPAANAAPVYIGPKGVTIATGYPLAPGESFEYEARTQIGAGSYDAKPGDFWAIGSAGTDKLAWLAFT